MNVVLVVSIIIVIAVIIAIIVIFHSNRNNVINPDTCEVAIDTVKNISSSPCCYVNSIVTPFKFVEDFNSVVGPNPVNYIQACQGFCRDADLNDNQTGCAIGSSEDFNKCINLIKPRNCKGLAMPIAASGNRLYYIVSQTRESCPCLGNCDGSSNC